MGRALLFSVIFFLLRITYQCPICRCIFNKGLIFDIMCYNIIKLLRRFYLSFVSRFFWGKFLKRQHPPRTVIGKYFVKAFNAYLNLHKRCIYYHFTGNPSSRTNSVPSLPNPVSDHFILFGQQHQTRRKIPCQGSRSGFYVYLFK